MNIREEGPRGNLPSVEGLTGKDLDQAFHDSFMWLRKAVYDPVFPRKYLSFEGGSVMLANPDNFVFEVRRVIENSVETYNITSEGLVSFKRKSVTAEIDSSILGKLKKEGDLLCLNPRIEEEKIAYFYGNNPSNLDENKRGLRAKQEQEERKRAAVKVVRWCQGQPFKNLFKGSARIDF